MQHNYHTSYNTLFQTSYFLYFKEIYCTASLVNKTTSSYNCNFPTLQYFNVIVHVRPVFTCAFRVVIRTPALS